MSSTDSPESAAATSLHEGVESSEGLRRLGRMAGIDSIDRNLTAEDAAADRIARLNDEEIYGKDAVAAVAAVDPPGDDEMKIMAARDVHYHEPPQPEETPATAPATKAERRRPSLLKNAVAIAAVVAGTSGLGAGVAIPWLLGMFDKTPPVVEREDRWIERVLESYVPPQGGVLDK